MCFDPLTALAIAGTGAQVFGSIQQGMALGAAGKAAQQQGDWNAEAGRVRAGERLAAASADAARQQTVTRLRMGQARANAAGSGLAIEGSPLEVLAFNAGQAELDRETILRQGAMDTRDLLAQAELDRWQGRVQRAQLQTQERAAYMRAGTSLLTGAGTWGRGLGGGGASVPTTAASRVGSTGRLAGPV